MAEVKIHSRPTGITRAHVIVTGGESPLGSPMVVLRVAALDNFDMPTVVTTLRLTYAEARSIAKLIADAAKEE